MKTKLLKKVRKRYSIVKVDKDPTLKDINIQRYNLCRFTRELVLPYYYVW